MTVDYKEYMENKQEFIRKHGSGDWKVETSPMDEYGRYHKEYIFDDGAIWYEIMSPEWFKQKVEVAHTLVTVEVEVKMFRTEFWNSDNAQSKFYYEKF